ncbi:hypothetical protein FACS1894169_10180 [Bacteroidia bacterium]|nr:hypothetical protein FACS1894169_10180 [Bacteroidia bacterium]
MPAQVTIGSDTPPNNGAILDVKSNDNTVNANGGINFPRVLISNFSPTTGNDFAASIGATGSWDMQKHIGLVVYNTGTPAGLHIWNGTRWIVVGGASPWNISGTSNAATSNTDNIYQMGSVSVGISGTVDPTAALNVASTNKGVLFPRVTLTSSTDNTTIPNPTTGLLVYNTGANSSFTTVGYMFWDGSQWRLFANASSEVAAAVLNCAGTQMSPNQQIVDATPIIAGTVLQIPYTGSNGGSFNGATLVSTGNPDVTATIAGGMLAVGNGVLSFSLSGVPTLAQQAPAGITFDLTPFLNANTDITGCDEVNVGSILSASIAETAVMGNFMLVTDNTGNDTGTQYYALQCNSPDGKFSVRAGVPASQTSIRHGNQYLNIQVRNNQSTDVPVIWNYETLYGGSISNAGLLTMPSQRWGGDQNSGGTWTNATGNNTSNGAFWGQVGIYDANNNGPEYRRYTWIPLGPNKVSYEITVMTALDTTTPTIAVPPALVKCYIKFTEVTAAQ